MSNMSAQEVMNVSAPTKRRPIIDFLFMVIWLIGLFIKLEIYLYTDVEAAALSEQTGIDALIEDIVAA